MKFKKFTALLTTTMIAASMLTGCGSDNAKTTQAEKTESDTEETSTTDTDTGTDKEYSEDEIKNFTFFGAMPQPEINDGNDIQEIIAKKVGVRVKETWLTGHEAIGTIIASDEYPDFIDGGDASKQLYDADALVAWDDYIDKYPNIKELYSDEEWDKFRQDDGHIYWIPQFSCIKGDEKVCTHNDEAFWIQARVLKYLLGKCIPEFIWRKSFHNP